MLKLIGLAIKAILFSLIVLVLGQKLHFGGRTVSDQVRIQLAHAEHLGTGEKLKLWAAELTKDAEKGFQRKSEISSESVRKSASETEAEDDIPVSEKQKLKSLIKDLNQKQSRR